MAQRNFRPANLSLEKGVTILHARCSIGAAGAVTNIQGEGFSTITKESGTGAYSFTLADKYNRLLDADIQISTATTASANIEITDTAFDSAIQAGTKVTFVCVDYAGAAVTLTNPSIMNIKVIVRNSSLKSKGE